MGRKPCSLGAAGRLEGLERWLLLSGGLDVVLIDSRLVDHETLARSAADAEYVVLYDGAKESASEVLSRITKLAESLEKEIESLSVLSHGAPGRFALGNEWVSQNTLGRIASAWRRLAGVLAPGANVYLYSCQVAAGPSGTQLVNALADLTGADVFASSNLTGFGGDWTLEVASRGAQEELAAGVSGPFDFSLLSDYCGNLKNAVAVDDFYVVNEDAVLAVPSRGVLENDTADNPGALTARLVTGPAHGRLTLNINGSFTYTPNANFCGVDSFTYRAKEDGQLSNVATVTILVNPVPDIPVILDQYFSVLANAEIGALVGVVAASDADEGQSLTYSIVAGNESGLFQINTSTGAITVANPSGLSGAGTCRLTVQASDDGEPSLSAQATVTVSVMSDEFTPPPQPQPQPAPATAPIINVETAPLSLPLPLPTVEVRPPEPPQAATDGAAVDQPGAQSVAPAAAAVTEPAQAPAGGEELPAAAGLEDTGQELVAAAADQAQPPAGAQQGDQQGPPPAQPGLVATAGPAAPGAGAQPAKIRLTKFAPAAVAAGVAAHEAAAMEADAAVALYDQAYTAEAQVQWDQLQVGGLWQHVEQMKDELDAEQEFEAMVAGTAAGMAVVYTAGYFLWGFRSSSLLASVVASVPPWICFDPLPIVEPSGKRRKKRRDRQAERGEDETDQAEELAGAMLGQ